MNPPQYFYGFVEGFDDLESARAHCASWILRPGIEFVTVREFKPGEMKPYEA